VEVVRLNGTFLTLALAATAGLILTGVLAMRRIR
jgi:hypothetical protein